MDSNSRLGWAKPVRLRLAGALGRDIDGAWWPRADRINNELPHLVAALYPILGDIDAIGVNWPALQRPPDLNWSGWERESQHIMTFSGSHARASLLVVRYTTNSVLAEFVLRCAARLPIGAADRERPACRTADLIVRAAKRQNATAKFDQPDLK
ncbi:DUF5994 family protein [Mycobacterium pinniadriaticum]|uniref:DUF5994 family protein n=1 Tax=Mycobacterium pinniadriaticum TaxID=2994102 RepID=UPI0038995419